MPVFLPEISWAGMLEHLPLPSDAVKRWHSCEPFLALFRLKLDLPCLAGLLLPTSNCSPNFTAASYRALLSAGRSKEVISSIYLRQLWS